MLPKFISHFSRRAVDRASIRTRYVGPCFDPLFAAKGGTLLSQCRSLMLSFRRESAIVPNRPFSVAVLSWVKSSPERLPWRAVRGLGAQSPNQTGSSRGVEGFIRLTGFPEREEQYGELSCEQRRRPASWPWLFPPGRDVVRARADCGQNRELLCRLLTRVLGFTRKSNFGPWIVRSSPPFLPSSVRLVGGLSTFATTFLNQRYAMHRDIFGEGRSES